MKTTMGEGTYLQSFFPVTIIGTLLFWIFWIIFKCFLSILVGIPAFIYQLIKTWFVQNEINKVENSR